MSNGMERRKFGPTEQKVAMIGQGTWYIESGERGGAIAALRRGIDLGLTHIDTAEMYGSGAAEELVGEAIVGRRDEIFLVSKVLPQNASRSGVIAACDRSLARLGSDRLDCYLLHWRGRHLLEETIAAFDELKQKGKILSWGVSNFDTPDLESVLKIAGEGNLACNQVLYHLEERAIEHSVIPWCARHNVAVVAYSPFGHGSFPSAGTAGGRVLCQIAETHRATVRQVALRFLARWPSVFVIPKASSLEHIAENAGTAELRLTQAEIVRINEAFPLGPPSEHLPML